jgi:phenylacetic acid degradation operon negative regulatory protein
VSQASAPQAASAGLRPLSARSAVLSLMLALHPPTLTAGDLMHAADYFDIPKPTMRVALTRMVAADDLQRTASTYTLSDRLLARQRHQDAAAEPRTRDWNGDWEMFIITTSGRGSTERAALRSTLGRLRLAELREGVWLRPDNLDRDLPSDLHGLGRRFTSRMPEDPATLAAELWDLAGWAAHATNLLELLRHWARPADRLTAAAATVRHLLTDPVLPAPLLPASWPAGELRTARDAHVPELRALGGSAPRN